MVLQWLQAQNELHTVWNWSFKPSSIAAVLDFKTYLIWLTVTYISLLSTPKVSAAAAATAPEQCNLNCFETKFTVAPLVLQGLRAGRWQMAKVWNPPPKKFPYLVSLLWRALFRRTGNPKSLIQGYNPSMLAGYRLSGDLSPDIRTELGKYFSHCLGFIIWTYVRKCIMWLCQVFAKKWYALPPTPQYHQWD